MRLGGSRSFGALVSPAGLHAVEYRHVRGGLRLVRSFRESASDWSAEQAADALGRVLESAGGRGGRLALAVKGFGSQQHQMMLPAAPRDVLLAVATREMRRFYPDLFADVDAPPLVDFVEAPLSAAAGAPPTRDLMVVGAPRRLVDTFVEALSRHGLRIHHWTIPPLVLHRLFESFVGAPDSRAVLLLTPEAPSLAFFQEGELRLFSEPHFSGAARDVALDTLVEQIRRGEIFLRQQFRGARLSRLHLAVGAEDGDRAAEVLRARLNLDVEPFSPYSGEPGAVAALGAALDARSERGLNLLPAYLRPPASAERWTRALAAASLGLLLAATGWWAWTASRAEERAASAVQAAEQSLLRRAAPFDSVRDVVEERQNHERRAVLLSALLAEHQRLPEILWPLQAASRIRVVDLQLDRVAEGWSGRVDGTAAAPTSAAATAEVETLYRELSRLFPGGEVTLERLGHAPRDPEESAASEVALNFRISFIVPSTPEPTP